jgi:hypothetical protein
MLHQRRQHVGIQRDDTIFASFRFTMQPGPVIEGDQVRTARARSSGTLEPGEQADATAPPEISFGHAPTKQIRPNPSEAGFKEPSFLAGLEADNLRRYVRRH